MIKKYPVELNSRECNLILENSVVSSKLEETLVRMSNINGTHKIQMSLNDISDLVGWMAAESNHTKNPQEAEELGDLCDYFESIEFSIKNKLRTLS